MAFITTTQTTTFNHVAGSFLHVTETGSILIDTLNAVGISISHTDTGSVLIDGLVSSLQGIGAIIGGSSSTQTFNFTIGQSGRLFANSFAIRIARDDAIVVNNGQVLSQTFAAIRTDIGVESGTLINSGTINSFNNTFGTIDYLGDNNTINGTFNITNSGSIINAAESGDAIQADFEDVNLTNSGLIQAANRGVNIRANNTESNSVVITNAESGIINAGGDGILLDNGLADAFITNHGQILARNHGLNLEMSTVAGSNPGVLLINTGTISTIELEAIDIDDARIRIINSGEIISIDNEAIIADGQNDGSSDAFINNSGRIVGLSNGIQLDDYNTIRIVNSGEISSENNALSLTIDSAFLSGNISVQNSGLITAINEAIDFDAGNVRLDNTETGVISAIEAIDLLSVDQSFTFTNAGSVDGSIGSNSNSSRTDFVQNSSTGVINGNISLGGGIDRIANQGQIVGDIVLTTGADADVVNNSGSIIGDINFGDGDDRLISSGQIDGMVDLDQGNDLAQISGVVTGDFFGGAGNDRVFLTGEVQGEIFLEDGNDFANLLGGTVTRVSGGLGDDTYLVDQASDILVVTEEVGAGVDLVRSTVSYRLSANVENLQLVGSGQLSGTGNELDNVLTGNSEDNQLEGLDGDDTLAGAGGNDTLIGGNGDDTFQDPLGNNILFGGNGNDTMTTGIGNDQLFGEAGDDLIFAGDGNDFLDGGLGFDRLNGGGGADVFDFNSTQDSLTSQADRILDFESGIDSIDLSDIFGGGFADFIGTDSFSAQGVAEVANAQVGTRLEVYVDANGDGVNDMTIFLLNTMSVEESDFILFESNAIA